MKQITMDKKTNITVDEAFQNFIRKCKVRNLAETTISTYTVHYKIFEEYINGKSLVNEIKPETWENFILYIRKNRNCIDLTINSYLRSIRTFFYYMMGMGYVESFKVNMLKTTKKIKETYSDEELRILLKKPNIKKCKFTEYRGWVVSNYLLATGNRISTALNVKIKDLDFENKLITLSKTKNRRAQIIPMSKALENVLSEYLLYRGGEPDDYLFCSVYGKKASVRAYETALTKYNRQRGVETVGLHRYRHTFAKNWILNGGDVFRLQKILGHSSLDIVKEYVEMFSSDLSRDFEEFNPLDNLQTAAGRKAIKMK